MQDAAIHVANDQLAIIIRPIPRQYTLDELLQEVYDDNRHDDYGSGKAQGREIW